jgi:hypothetical protein
MDINKILKAQAEEYQLTVARAVVNYTSVDPQTQEKMLESYKSIIRDREDEEYYNRELVQNQGLDIDQYLDDPRHGQSSKGEH